MIRFTTKSGAVYLLDEEQSLLQRQSGEMNPYLRLDNEEWAVVTSHTELEIGQSVSFALAEGHYRRTTPLVSIEEV